MFSLRQCSFFQGLAVEIYILSPLMWIKVTFRKWNFYSTSSPISTKARISNISFVVKLLYIICAEINIYIYNGDCEEDGLGGVPRILQIKINSKKNKTKVVTTHTYMNTMKSVKHWLIYIDNTHTHIYAILYVCVCIKLRTDQMNFSLS